MPKKRRAPMKLSREEKKAKLMVRLERAVDELIEWEEENTRPTLTQIEDIVLKLRKEMGEEMAAEILAEVEGKTTVPGPACPKCGREMRFKGEYEKQIESRAGGMEYERGYYACPVCDEGLFPPG
jgi:NMD protein affecting ribosome stability and mRNA decay